MDNNDGFVDDEVNNDTSGCLGITMMVSNDGTND